MGTIANEIQRLQQAKANIKTSIENKGVVVPSATKLDGYSTLIDQISQGTSEAAFNDVNFYDYDGRRLYSYSKSEFANLTAMPEVPTHDGLTSQGWNWTLSDAQSYVAFNGILDIGMYYVTNDNKTRIYISLPKELLSLYLGVAVNGSVTVEWGDGNTETISGTSGTTIIFTPHTYATKGNYVIKLYSAGTYRIAGGNYSSHIITTSTTDDYRNIVYVGTITKIELASNVELGRFALNQTGGIQAITITSTTEIKDSSCFLYTSLRYLTIPRAITGSTQFNNSKLENVSFCKGITNSTGLTFANVNSLKRVCLPDTLVTISTYLLQNANSVSYIKLPKSLTTISGRAFYQAYGLKVADFSDFTAIPTISIDNVFGSNQTDLKIVVPDNLYNSWIGETNWSNYASYIIKESDYNA